MPRTPAATPDDASARSSATRGLTYAQAGVDIHAGDAMVQLIKASMQRTYGPRVLAGRHGGFAGCVRLDYNEKLFQRNYRDPVLVACTDGVGTKVLLACELGIHHTVGQDLVAMNVNDLVVQGAEPLLFLDYIGVSQLRPEWMAEIVRGVADGCQLAGCSLIGGETAEMPDVYRKGEYDLAGFAVGVCELHRLIDGSRASAGDVILGVASSGVHSNGFTLVRKIVDHAGLDLHAVDPELDPDRKLGEVLLTPTRIYARQVVELLRSYRVKQPITAMCHITGGGLEGNLPRVIPEGVEAVIDPDAWDVPPIFRYLQRHGEVDEAEMWRVFNMGVGFVFIVRPHFADAVLRRLKRMHETAFVMGELRKGPGPIAWRGARRRA